jgi:hypothetical protein
MSARKLGRLAGLVFVLTALLGGAGAGFAASDSAPAAQVTSQIIIDWG